MTGPGKRVALVLGSGGARGYAHIGVLQVLSERGYEVAAIAGTSMGAVVGGLAAAGKLEPYTEWVRGLTQGDVLRLLDPAFSSPGAFRAERVLARMSEILGGALIEDLPIPFTAVATDLGTRREVWFTSGPVDVALRASIAIPSLITPIMVNGRLLVDGGLLNPVPVEPVIGVDADFTLAVSLTGWTPWGTADATRESSVQRPPPEWLDRFLRTASGVLESDLVLSVLARLGTGRTLEAATPTVPPPYDPPPPNLGIVDVTSMALDTMTALVTRYRMAAQPPDILVTVPAAAARTVDFHRAVELIELGRKLTAEALDRAFGPAGAGPAPTPAAGAVGLVEAATVVDHAAPSAE